MTADELPVYRDPRQPIDVRIEDLLGRMTLEEKLAQLGCVWSTALVKDDAFSIPAADQFLARGTGHITRIGASTGLRPNESAAFMNTIQRHLVEKTRLGIPAIVHEESTAGLCARDATQFPQAIGLASSWDPDIIEEMAGVIREQMRAVGARHTLAPVLDVSREPRWGRTEETYGEDPYLAGRMGVAYVRGLQTNDLARGVVATGKHFLGYGMSEGGLNHAPAHIGPRELREVFAAPFGAAIRDAGLAAVMNAYNEVDGLACGASAALLTGLLREELGFRGLVVADYFTVSLLISHHGYAADKGEAAQQALQAGLDVELPALDCYGAPLQDRVESGALQVEVVDRSVRRLLRHKFELGLFENPYADDRNAAGVFDTPAQRALARRVAQESIVLLKNEGALLPLDPGISSLAVIGPSADDPRLLQGDYHYPAHCEVVYERLEADGRLLPTSGGAFSPGPYFVPTVTPLEGIRRATGARTEILVAAGCDITGNSTDGFAAAVDAARRAAVAVLFVGGKSGLMPHCTSGEARDASDLNLTGVQLALAEAVLATGTPTVVVLINGRVLAPRWLAEHVPALVEAWLPGEEGGNAIADVLFGAVNPAGRLPISIPRSVGQVPVYYNHKRGGGKSQFWGEYTDGPTAPQFPFGHGLSYTSFSYDDLRIDPAAATTADALSIGVTVTNTGERAGDEVVQLYLRDEVASVTRPVKQLAGFLRTHLRPGEAQRITFRLDQSQLAFYDQQMRFVIEPGAVTVMVGASSQDIRLEQTVQIGGRVREISQRDIVATQADSAAAEAPVR